MPQYSPIYPRLASIHGYLEAYTRRAVSVFVIPVYTLVWLCLALDQGISGYLWVSELLTGIERSCSLLTTSTTAILPIFLTLKIVPICVLFTSDTYTGIIYGGSVLGQVRINPPASCTLVYRMDSYVPTQCSGLF